MEESRLFLDKEKKTPEKKKFYEIWGEKKVEFDWEFFFENEEEKVFPEDISAVELYFLVIGGEREEKRRWLLESDVIWGILNVLIWTLYWKD